MDGFYQTYIDAFETIEFALSKRKQTPALTLIYAGIDSFSWLADNEDLTGRKRFIKWCEKWMLKDSKLICSANDIYSARCGLLHNLASESKMTRENKAKQIIYSWGNVESGTLNEAIKSIKEESNYIAIKIEDLYSAYRQGVSKCFEELIKDPEKKHHFEAKVKKLFISKEIQ